MGRAVVGIVLIATTACAGWIGSTATPLTMRERSMVVTASAYNSVVAQTDDTPDIAAWGARLSPGMQAIAVSRDLLDLGLGNGAVIRIDGLPGEWTVLDRMHPRWSRKIDLYMGTDIDAAKQWGVRNVRIRWFEPIQPPLPGSFLPRPARSFSAVAMAIDVPLPTIAPRTLREYSAVATAG